MRYVHRAVLLQHVVRPSVCLYVTLMYRGRTGRAKKVIPWEKFDISGIVADFSPNLQRLEMRIQAIYPANFIKMTDVVQQMQQFKL